ncbi:MAG TPA: hypothetical protein PK431_17335 [Chitinophagales bacterium]|nr:hypothetical protein [Chitinophagales bacterium]
MKYSDIIQLDKKNYITTLQDVNWFKYADIDEVTTALNETENNLMFVYALEEFVFVDDNFIDAKSYEQFLYTFLKEFQLDFTSTNVMQDDNLITLTIVTKNHTHEYIVDLDVTEDYFDLDLIDYFFNKEFLVKENILERFYFLPEIDENLSLYFTHPTIQHKAVKAGLIPTKNEFYQMLDSIKEDDEELDN